MIDKLIEGIKSTGNPTAVGLDTSFDYLPDNMKKNCRTPLDAAQAITEFNLTLIDRLHTLVPAVKVQVALSPAHSPLALTISARLRLATVRRISEKRI